MPGCCWSTSACSWPRRAVWRSACCGSERSWILKAELGGAMFSDPVLAGMAAFLVVFVGITALGFMLTLQAFGDRRLELHRLRGLAQATPTEPARKASWMGKALSRLGALVGTDKKDRVDKLRARLLHAGYFQAQ